MLQPVSEPVSFLPPKPPFETVLVTGGAGFIGSRTVSLLARLGCRVIVVDNGYIGLPLPRNSARVTSVDADIRSRDKMTEVLSEYRPDVILHLAAVHHIPTCEREPYLAFEVNVLGTQALLDAAAAAATTNIVMASSGAVYIWQDGPLKEGMVATGANDVYSTTKLANEYQLDGWATRVGGRARIARLFNVIGAGDPNGHLIPNILEQIAGDDPNPTIRLGNVLPKRDYIYVDDVASGLVSILTQFSHGPACDTFNVCTGREVSVQNLVELLGQIMRKTVAIESDPARIRKVDRMQQLGDPEKLMTRAGWFPAWDLRAALKATVRDLGYPVPNETREDAV